jgi:hypothetical protein
LNEYARFQPQPGRFLSIDMPDLSDFPLKPYVNPTTLDLKAERKKAEKQQTA